MKTCLLVWKFMIDITPTLFDHYKMKAFSEFRKMLGKRSRSQGGDGSAPACARHPGASNRPPDPEQTRECFCPETDELARNGDLKLWVTTSRMKECLFIVGHWASIEQLPASSVLKMTLSQMRYTNPNFVLHVGNAPFTLLRAEASHPGIRQNITQGRQEYAQTEIFRLWSGIGLDLQILTSFPPTATSKMGREVSWAHHRELCLQDWITNKNWNRSSREMS
jgi:hypothetical protein